MLWLLILTDQEGVRQSGPAISQHNHRTRHPLVIEEVVSASIPKLIFWIGTAMAEQRDLPGWPKKRLVKLVRSHLWRYGIRPAWKPWHAAWSWAHAIAFSYYHTRWPSASEISTQYILLLLVEMKQNFALRLPYRAGKVIPDEVRVMLPCNPVPLLIHEPVDGVTKSSD
jgi:hypothetical protein